MVVDAAPASGFTMLQAKQQFNIVLLEDHRVAVAQLEVERADAAVGAELLASPGVLDENQAVLVSVQSRCTVKRKRHHVRISSARPEWRFEELEVDNNEASSQHDQDAKTTFGGGFGWLSRANDDEVGGCGPGVVDLTSDEK